MFSPSQIIQSFVQKAPISAPKPVELTPGQVFKGTVIKHYPDNMALVQVGGMQVQAKMETNLEAGQKAWLQVQPSTGVVTLKVLESPGEMPGKEASLDGLMKSLGIADTKENKAIVQALLGGNLPVNKETIQAFSAVAQRLGTDNATIEAFMTAMKRNLPLTPDTIAGLKAFLSDKPMGQAIQNLLQQATLFLDAEGEATPSSGQLPQSQSQPPSGQANAASIDVKQLVSQLKDKLGGLSLLVTSSNSNGGMEEGLAVKQMPQSTPVMHGAQTSAGGSQAQPQQGMSGQPPALGQLPTQAVNPSLPQTTQNDSALAQTNPTRSPQEQTTSNMGGKQAGPLGNDLTGKGNQAVSTQPVTQEDGQTIARTQSASAQQSAQVSQGSSINNQPIDPKMFTAEAGQKAVPSTMFQASGPTAASNPIVELFRQLGIGHERELMGQAFSQGASDLHSQKQIETVKSLLLQIQQAPSQAVPAALREAADQLLQQVTGQQLMMLQPSNQALTQIVMQIPIRQAEGDETAFVQIESKKQGSGQLDPENCRLFFHLELQSMGRTMIDVSIVNRIVNLQIFNDTPWVETLVLGTKERFAEQLQDVGYHLSAMRVQPVPTNRGKLSGPIHAKGPLLADYKGVDLRV